MTIKLRFELESVGNSFALIYDARNFQVVSDVWFSQGRVSLRYLEK